MEVKELLNSVKQANKKVVEINTANERVRGYVLSKVETIKAYVAELVKAGYDIEFKMLDEVTIHPDTIARFKEIYSEVYHEVKQSSDKLEEILKAVEAKDYKAIKKLTGQDVSKVSYDVEIADVTAVKDAVATATANINSETISTGEKVQVLDTGTGTGTGTATGTATGNADGEDDFEDDEDIDFTEAADAFDNLPDGDKDVADGGQDTADADDDGLDLEDLGDIDLGEDSAETPSDSGNDSSDTDFDDIDFGDFFEGLDQGGI